MTHQPGLFDAPLPSLSSPGLTGGSTPAARDRDTSQAAARSMREPAPILRARVLAAIAGAGMDGLTADEAAELLALSVLAVRPRVSELGKAGAIADSGRRRRNASGRAAAVWIAKHLLEEL